MTPPSTDPRRRSTIPTTSTSSSTITAGASGSLKANESTTIMKDALPPALPSRFRRSRSKVMPTAHRIQIPAPTETTFPGSTSTARSRVASGTICLKKRPRLLHGRLSTSLLSDRSARQALSCLLRNTQSVPALHRCRPDCAPACSVISMSIVAHAVAAGGYGVGRLPLQPAPEDPVEELGRDTVLGGPVEAFGPLRPPRGRVGRPDRAARRELHAR